MDEIKRPGIIAPGLAVAQLVITLTAAGNVQMNGPIQDKILCLGMIELAKAGILNYTPAPDAGKPPFSLA